MINFCSKEYCAKGKCGKPKRGIIKNCDYCGKEFYIRPSLINRRFCSEKCYGLNQRGNKELKCKICGKPFYCSQSQEKLRHRQHCSQKCAIISRKIKAQEKRKTLTVGYRNRLERRNRELEDWRGEIFRRDNYRCRICGQKATLNAHHILPFAYYPEYRLEPNNGVSLCLYCHHNLPHYKNSHKPRGVPPERLKYIQENFVEFYIGIKLNNQWYLEKREFDKIIKEFPRNIQKYRDVV